MTRVWNGYFDIGPVHSEQINGLLSFFYFDWAVPISQCSFAFIFFPHFWAEKTNQNGLFISPMIYCFFLNTYIMIVITEGKENLNFGSLNERETDCISELPKKIKINSTLPVNFHFYTRCWLVLSQAVFVFDFLVLMMRWSCYWKYKLYTETHPRSWKKRQVGTGNYATLKVPFFFLWSWHNGTTQVEIASDLKSLEYYLWNIILHYILFYIKLSCTLIL